MNSDTRPTISAIVVNYNAGALLELCIDRIRKSNPAVELILVDNCSKDISQVWTLSSSARKHEKYIRNNRNLGFSAAVNIGANVASGDVLIVINPDCLVLPHTIDRLCELIKEQQRVGLVGGLVFGLHGREQPGCRRYDVTPMRSIGKVLRKVFPLENIPTIDMTSQQIPQNIIDVDAVSGSFFAMRRSLYKKLGGMDEDYFLHFEDLDLCRRVRNEGYRVVFNPNVSVVHVGAISGGVTSAEIARHKHNSLRVYFKKHLRRYSLTAVTVTVMSQLYLWLRAVYQLIGPDKRYHKKLDLFEDTLSVKNAKEVFVIGDRCQLLRSIVVRLAVQGYVVVVETSDPQSAPNLPRVSWVTSEYIAKVPETDIPEFSFIICIGSIERLRAYQERFAHQELGSQLLIETGSKAKVLDGSNTVEKISVDIPRVDWFQRRLLRLWLWRNKPSPEMSDMLRIKGEVDSIYDLSKDHHTLSDSCQQVHVDDVSELCLDVFATVSKQECNVCSYQILKDCLERFSRRIRPLHN